MNFYFRTHNVLVVGGVKRLECGASCAPVQKPVKQMYT